MKAVRPRAMAMGLTDQRSTRRVVPNPRRAVPAGLVAGRGSTRRPCVTWSDAVIDDGVA